LAGLAAWRNAARPQQGLVEDFRKAGYTVTAVN